MSTATSTLPRVKGAMSMTQLKNRLVAINPDLKIELKNVRISGSLRGCSGFVTNPDTGKIAYVNTESGLGNGPSESFYRTAKDDRDYQGGQNHFSRYDDLAAAVVKLIG